MPGSDALLKILLQEDGNAVSEATKTISGATQKVIGAKDTVVGYFSGDKSTKSAEKPAPLKSAYFIEIQHFKLNSLMGKLFSVN